MNATDMVKDKVERLVTSVIKTLFSADSRFFINDAEERTLVGRTAIRLFEKKEELSEISRELGIGELSVDYALRGSDIIVHERGSSNDVLVLRIRKNASEEMKVDDIDDIEKLVERSFMFGVTVGFMVHDGEIGYETPFGISKY